MEGGDQQPAGPGAALKWSGGLGAGIFAPGPLARTFCQEEGEANNSFGAYRFSRIFFIHLAVEAQRIS